MVSRGPGSVVEKDGKNIRYGFSQGFLYERRV